LGIVMCVGMMAPVLTDMALQVVRGDALPAVILVVYCVAGAALYVGYGLRRSRRLASASDGIDQ
ncbi:MAG: hypothetical protein ABW178_13805, partial [Pseudoxanthomonas sp.]